MGQAATVLSVDRTTEDGVPVVNITCDPGGGANLTVQHFEDSGSDSLPLPGDTAAIDDSTGTGTAQLTGYHDPKNPGKAAGGEKRLYSRTPAGIPAAEVWLKTDGSVVITGLLVGGGSARLDPLTGTWNLNGATIDKQGNISTPGEITAKNGTPATSVSLSTHLHGSGTGPTTAPTPGT